MFSTFSNTVHPIKTCRMKDFFKIYLKYICDVGVFNIYLGQKEMEIIVKILENCWNVSAKNLMAFKLNPFWIRFILWWYDEEIAMEGIGTAGKIMCFCIFRILSRLRNSTNTCFVFIKSERRENRPVLISHMVAIWSLKFAVS